MDASKWSSYRATAGLASVSPFLSFDWMLGQFGTNRRAAQKRYREFAQGGIKNRPWDELKRPDLLGQR
jgi:putative transposase